MNVESAAGEGSNESEEHSRESHYCHREYLNDNKQTIFRNINVIDVAAEDIFLKNLIFCG